MSDAKYIFVLGFYLFGFCGYQVCLKGIPERAVMEYYDEQYCVNASINVRRIRKGGDYVVNINCTLLQCVGNNVTMYLNFYEYLNNEYKPSFIQMHFKLCDLIVKDKLIGQITRKAGIVTCPLVPGTYALKNLYFNDEIPSVFPFEKGMLEIIFKHDAKPNGIVLKFKVMVSFMNVVPLKLKQTKASVTRAETV